MKTNPVLEESMGGNRLLTGCLSRAEVIKIEHPTRGDDTRAWGPPYAKYKDGGMWTGVQPWNCWTIMKLTMCLQLQRRKEANQAKVHISSA